MSTPTFPVLFIGHGSPMNAIENNEFTQVWQMLGAQIQNPSAIICISAHWETNGTFITGNLNPLTIHDFYGFPQELYDLQYPASGDPNLAKKIQKLIKSTQIQIDPERGFDHGSWAVIKSMYPNANIPLIQINMDRTKSPKFHYELGRELASLRKDGVLFVGSGNVVHNLRAVDINNPNGVEKALKFDQIVKESIESRNHIP